MRRTTLRRIGALVALALVMTVGTTATGDGTAPTPEAATALPAEQAGAPAAKPDIDVEPASARETARAKDVDLPRPVHGATAIRLLGDDLDEAAALNKMPAEDLAELLRTDSTAWVDTDGAVFFKDAAVAPQPETPVQALAPLNQTFTLHSKAGATRTIFLDFDGGTASATLWHQNYPATPTTQPAWDPAGNGASFTDTELTSIQAVWESVAEDYAPFDVDVTTADPGAAAINRDSAGDTSYGSHVLITPSTGAAAAICNSGCGGVAYLNAFGATNGGGGGDGYGYRQPAWVFPQLAGNNAKGIAEAASHEVGHQLGLSHDGLNPTVDDYDEGHGAWAPIMGAGYYHPITQWSKGDYAGADNQQDDIAIVRAVLGLRADEAGSSIATAATSTAGTSYITSRSDVDVFRLGACSGAITVSANPLYSAPDVDLKLSLVNAAGTVVATADPASAQSSVSVATGLNATISPSSLAASTYYVAVDGVGNGPWSTGYDDYGSLGAYTLSTTGNCNGAAPTGVPTAPSSPAAAADTVDAKVTVTWAAPSSAGSSAVTGYVLTRSGDDSPVQVAAGTTSYTWTGLAASTSYSFTITALNASGPGATSTVSATTSSGIVVPTAPQSVTSTWSVLAQSATITWSPPAVVGSGPVLDYYLYFNGSAFDAVPGSWNSVDLMFSGAGTFTIGVAARNQAGVGPVATTSVTVPARATNDLFANRAALSGVSGTVTGDNTASWFESGEVMPAGSRTSPGTASVWYSWTAPASGPATFTTTSAVTDRDTILSVYTGSAVSSLTAVATNDEPAGGGHLAAVSFTAIAGTTYAISVDGYRSFAAGVGPFTLSWSGTAVGPKATTTDLTATASGRTVTLKATVTATFGTPYGSVEFLEGTTSLGWVDADGSPSTLILTDQPRGQHTYTARYVPDNSTAFTQSTSPARSVTLAATTTTTTLQASVSAQSVTLTAAVTPATGTATGTVQFKEGSSVVGTATVASGSATAVLASVAPGSHTYTATFVPSDLERYAGSTSSSATVTVAAPPPAQATTTTLSGQVSGRSATLAVTVTAASGTPTGTVQISDAGTVVGTGTLFGGSASVVVSDLTKGTHQFTATYLPANPATYATSTSSATGLTIAATPTTTTLGASVSGFAVTLDAAVSPAAAGTVEVREGGTLVGTATLTAGAGQVVLTGVTVGAHTYTATFVPADDLRYASSTSSGVGATVVRASSSSVLSTSVAYHRVTLAATVTVSAGTPAGQVTFWEGSTVVGTATVAAGAASVELTGVATGSHSFRATFTPADTVRYTGSSSAIVAATVAATPTTTTLATTATGQKVDLAATLAAEDGIPAGTVEFREDGVLLGTTAVESGAAGLTLQDVSPGQHSYTATYVPTGTTHAGSSATRSATVTVDTVTTLAAAVVDREVTLTAAVDGPGTPTGTVTFKEGATVVGTRELVDGTAVLSLPDLMPGQHSYTATFAATDTTAYRGSVSAGVTATVAKIATTTSLAPVASGRTVTLTATVTTGFGTLPGSVTFYDGAVTLGTRTVSGGVATLTLSNVAFGPHAYTATYAPSDTVHQGSTSAEAPATVLGSTVTTLAAGVTGRTVALTATVTTDGTAPAGYVSFLRNGTVVANVVVANGLASTSQPNLTPGTYTYSARFTPSSSANHATSTSSDLEVTVLKVTSTTALTAAVNDRTVTLDSTVTTGDGVVAGKVQIRDGETLVGEPRLVGGAARLVLTSVVPGAHTYTSTFVPDTAAVYAGSISPERTVTAARIATTTALQAQVDVRSVTLTATPATLSGALTGSVEFYDGGELVATRPLVDGAAVLALADVAPGAHAYTATFVPSGTTHGGSTSTTKQVTAAAYATTTTLGTSVLGRTVRLAATVASATGSPGGDVVFREGVTVLGTVPLAAGDAALVLPLVSPGTHTYTATYVPAQPVTYAASSSSARQATVDPIATSTSLTATPDAQDVTLDIGVTGTSGTPTGTVVVREGTTVVATRTLTAGAASATLHDVTPGEHTYRATYEPADPVTYAGSVSPARTVTADPIATRTTLTADVDGDVVHLEASLDEAGAGGEVVFREGGTVVGRAELADGTAPLTLPGVAIGEHSYTATFVPADPATYAGSESATRTVVVKVPTSTTLAAEVDGRTVTLDAEVTGAGSPAGEVVFRDRGAEVRTVAVDEGGAHLTLDDVAPGPHSYTAAFVPTDTDTVAGSVSAPRTVTVDPYATTTTLLTDVEGRQVTLDAEVTSGGGTPVGEVVLREGGEDVATVSLSAGAAGTTLLGVTPGTHSYTAHFVPADPVTFRASTSSPATATVDPVATTTTLEAAADGRTVTLDVDVTSSYGVPQGEVEIRDGDDALDTVTLEDGAAGLTLTDVDPGEHDYTATYVPTDAVTHAGSASDPVPVVIAAITTETTLSAVADGQDVTLDVEVAGARTPVGSVVLREGDDEVGTVSLTDGAATLTLPDVDPGEHAYTAEFVPTDAVRFSGSTSGAASVSVERIVTTTGLTVEADHRTVALEATVVGGAAGTVVFHDGETAIGERAVDAGSASMSIDGVDPGPHTFTATFVPTDADRYVGSVSLERSVTVAPIATETALSTAVDVRTVSLDAMVTAPGVTPSGSVVFREGDDEVGTVALVDGAATLALELVRPGSHTYTASFVPDSTVWFDASASSERTAVVEPIVTTTTLTPVADGLDVTLGVLVTGATGSPEGEVVLREGDDVLGTLWLDEGAASLVLEDQDPGEHTYSATFRSDDPATYADSGSGDQPVTVGRIATTTDLTTAVEERTVSLRATVDTEIGDAEGSITFGYLWGPDYVEEVATVPLVDGVATYRDRRVAPGSRTYIATYVPAGTSHGSSSDQADVTVSDAAIRTTTSLSASARSDRTVRAHIEVTTADGPAEGIVYVYDGDNLVDFLLLVDGVAETDVGPLALGSRTIRAEYVPDNGSPFGRSSAEAPVEILGSPTAAALTATVDGSQVKLSAKVVSDGGTPRGYLSFAEGSTVLAEGVWAGDGTGATTVAATGGSHTYRVEFTPLDGTFQGSSAVTTVTVDPTATTTTLAAQRTKRSVTLTASVGAPAGTPGGTVVFTDGETTVATAPVASGKASATLARVTTGDHDYAARFVPTHTTAYAGSEASTSFAMPASATSTTLTAQSTSTTVTFTTAVTSVDGTPSGTVEIVEDETVVQTVALVDGTATAAAVVAPGAHVYRARFVPTPGDRSFAASASPERSLTVHEIDPAAATSTVLTVDAVRRTVTLTAVVSSAATVPAGRVQFAQDGVVVQPAVPLVSGTASLVLTAVGAGPHTYTATFLATVPTAFEGSVSLGQQATIAATPTTTTLGGSMNGTTAVLDVTVAGTDGIVPSGTVDVLDNGALVAAAVLTGGRASVLVPGVGVGGHSYTARFAPDSLDQSGSASPTVFLSVAAPAPPPTVEPPVTTPVPPPAAVASKLVLTAPKSAKAKSRPVVKVRVTRGSAPATGKVVLTVGKTKVTLTLKSGAASYKLPKAKKGTLKLTAAYAGDATTGPATASTSIKVK